MIIQYGKIDGQWTPQPFQEGSTDSLLLLCIRGRIKQHKDNLELWRSGALNYTVEDGDEKEMVIHDLCVGIEELETVLRYVGLVKPAIMAKV